jgi:hypothetical protein
MDRTTVRVSSEKVSYRPLALLEKVIQEGQLAYVEVGKALQEIQKGKLYRKNYNTFEEYCEKRWGFDRQTAHNYIKATEVAENIAENVNSSLQKPSFTQARELAILDPDQQKEIAKKVDFANTTVKELKAKIDKVRDIDPSQQTKVESPEKTLEQWLDEQITKIALQPYGHYAAKFEKYPWQHPTDRANVEGSVLDIYKAIAAICAKKLGKVK